MPLATFHPAVAAWFAQRFAAPTPAQAAAWPSIRAGCHTLIAAPTGSGKTLAAFLAAIDALVEAAQRGELADTTQVVYVSPLKALASDIQRNLQEPLEGIREQLTRMGLPDAPIRTLVRSGDTPAWQRQTMARRPPHILVTTPESLYILLTSASGRRMLATARTVIVDEIHAVLADKRGSHLALSLERLEELAQRPLVRIGLSATQRPIAEVARFLVGCGSLTKDGAPGCAIVDAGHRRDLDLQIELPRSPLSAVMEGEVWEETYDRLAQLVGEHRTTLIFVNTRRMAERVSRHLGERLGEDVVAAHHGSLSRQRRQAVEQRLKAGELRALVATASLELGVDIGAVDLVCTVGSTRAIATLLQRVGRSGHFLAGLPKGRLFPLSRDELVESAALMAAVRAGELEELRIPPQPLDILAQQMVAAVACRDYGEEELFALVRRAYPYRDLTRVEFDAIVQMLAEGFHTRRGRRGALLHHDVVHGRLRARRGARLLAMTSGGAIPDTADYSVVLQTSGTVVGTLNEDFAIESAPGDVFQLGDSSWRILRVQQGRVLVDDARGAPPSIPFWLGEAPGRSAQLSAAVSRLRADVQRWLEEAADDPAAAIACTAEALADATGIGRAAAEQVAGYLAAGRAALGALPTQQHLILERFFDEAGDMHLVLHAPFGSRLNRAWGLALRKRFCRAFNFELQAAATEDSIVLSLGPTHSFPVADVFRYLHSSSAREVLTQALLEAPMFPTRWRWNATRSLALPRWRSGRRVAAPLQRMQAEDLLAVVFPDQLACAENVPGDRDIPDHPLVQQTVRDCLTEAMDVSALEGLLRQIEAGEVRCSAVELTEPSPLAHEVLGARPYAFLDDAPLEERRTRAVATRRWIDTAGAADLGRLDAAAIASVRAEAWPAPRDADELHDALVVAGFVTAQEGRDSGWQPLFNILRGDGSATLLRAPAPGHEVWLAAERLDQARAAWPQAALDPPLAPLPRRSPTTWNAQTALVELLRGRLEVLGPVTARALAVSVARDEASVLAALAALETEGFVLQGRFTQGAQQPEWCERRLLARIHRATVARLRREIEPVAPADFMRFLFAWQRVAATDSAEGMEGLAAVLEQLEGFACPAAAWEEEILPARVRGYEPAWLDGLCLSGRFLWARGAGTTAPRESSPRTAVLRTTPICLVRRANAALWRAGTAASPSVGAAAGAAALSHPAQSALRVLYARGASFFEEIVQSTGLLRTQTELALAELVARGLVSADSTAGLRALLVPAREKERAERRSRRRLRAAARIEQAGRWYCIGAAAGALHADGRTGAAPTVAPDAARGATRDGTLERARGAGRLDDAAHPDDSDLESIARTLLRRYGVVFRRLLEREPGLPPWRNLLPLLWRLEARGELRGGRFVDTFSGEQFALAAAVARLREVRRDERRGILVGVSAADPLNLTGIVTSGERVPGLTRNRVLYRDGEPIAVYEGRVVKLLVGAASAQAWEIQRALVRRAPAHSRAAAGER
jgi:ATP-dependent Lhr-like helicase